MHEWQNQMQHHASAANSIPEEIIVKVLAELRPDL